jgi:hypothetical protein
MARFYQAKRRVVTTTYDLSQFAAFLEKCCKSALEKSRVGKKPVSTGIAAFVGVFCSGGKRSVPA